MAAPSRIARAKHTALQLAPALPIASTSISNRRTTTRSFTSGTEGPALSIDLLTHRLISTGGGVLQGKSVCLMESSLPWGQANGASIFQSGEGTFEDRKSHCSNQGSVRYVLWAIAFEITSIKLTDIGGVLVIEGFQCRRVYLTRHTTEPRSSCPLKREGKRQGLGGFHGVEWGWLMDFCSKARY